MGKLRDGFLWQFLPECDSYFPGVLHLFQGFNFFLGIFCHFGFVCVYVCVF